MKNYIIYIFLIILFITSCVHTKYVEVPVETVTTEYIKDYQRDTIIIRDSVDRWLKNDTVFIYKYKYLYKTLYQTDTILRTDTIANTIYVDKIVTVNELKDWQKFFIYMGIFFIIFIIFVLYKKFKL